ncbi:trypsin-like peptidase domain-containing protein [Streptomyces sp. NPDC003077]|uniref:nSTAND1 domain-containing NTPase n=1 Tax=Streptomyces sp. NPDC003077 TaxID=3154443 RepID=UPI00339E473D
MTDGTTQIPAVLSGAVAQVLDRDGGVAGAGFLVDRGTVVTCAHVVHAAGYAPGATVWLAFPHTGATGQVPAEVLAGPWRPPESQDIAVLRLKTTPPGVEPLPLGAADGTRGHRVRAYGFPAQAPPGGHFGYAVAGDLLAAGNGSGPLLQLTGANDLTTGFSGGPVVDERTGLVIGMVTSIAAPDQHLKGLSLAYATPTEVLRETWPDLVEQQVCPYRGLEPFTAEHAEWFHGRDAAVHSVLAALGRQRRLLLLLGPSGAGKSSLVRAGVLPALAEGRIPGSDRWLPILARPGQDLPAELERAGLPGAAADGILPAIQRRLATAPDHERLIVVIDQFEELFAQASPANGHEPGRAARAVRELVAVGDSHAAVTVVLIMRDDFYPQLAALAPELLEAAAPGLLNVPATLGIPELHAIITQPALAVGARVEDGLPERIINDILAASPTRQASITLLPPLQLALRQLWERRVDGCLTHHAYQRIGEITGNLATWCDTALNQLPDEQRPIAQRILTALVRPADEAHAVPATRQQVPLARLRALTTDTADPDHSGVFDDVLAALTRHRIITTGTVTRPGGAPGEPTAELIHDALIRDWGDLRDWVAEDHRFQVWLHRAAEQHTRHTGSGLPADLLDGTALAEGTEWARQRPLPAEITAFLTASRRRQRAAIRRRRGIISVLAGILGLALVLGSLYVYQRQVARERDAVAASRALAQSSADQQRDNPELAAKLAIASYDASPTQEARNALLRNYLGTAQLHRMLSGTVGGVSKFQTSRDGNVVMTVSHRGKATVFVNAVTGTVRSEQVDTPVLATSPLVSGDGKRVGAVLDDGSIVWYEVGKPGNRILGAPHRLPAVQEIRGFRNPITHIDLTSAMSDDGHRVAVSSAKDLSAVIWWNTETGKTEGRNHLSGVHISHVRFSSDNRSLLLGDTNKLFLVDRKTNSVRALVNGVTDYAVSGDATAVVTCREEGPQVTLRSQRVSDGAELGRFAGISDMEKRGISCSNLATDEKGLLAISGDHPPQLPLIDLKRGRFISRVHWQPAGKSDFQSLVTTGDKLLLVSGHSASVNITDIPTFDAGKINEAALTRDGKREIVLVNGGSLIQIRDATDPRKVIAEAHRPKPFWVHEYSRVNPSSAATFALHERKNLLADRVGKDSIAIRDATSLRQKTLIRMPHSPQGADGDIDKFIFGRDGNLITSSGTLIRQWDSLTGRELARYDVAALGHSKETAYGAPDKPANFSLSPHPGANQVAIVWPGNPDINVVDMRKGRITARYATGPDVIDVAFDRDARYLAVIRIGSTVELWKRSPLRKELGPLPVSTDTPDRLGFLNGEGRFSYSYRNKIQIYRAGSRAYETSWDLGQGAGADDAESPFRYWGVLGISDDGKTIILTTPDKRDAQLISFRPEVWRKKLCDVIAKREFTKEERESLPTRLPTAPLCP